MSYFKEISIGAGDNASSDAFGRFRVSEPVSLFDSKQCVSNDGYIWDTATSNGSTTFSPTTASTALNVTATAGAYSIRQTYQRMNYVPAKSQLIFLTATDMHPQTGVTKRIGYFNSNLSAPYDSSRDGLYWESSSGAISVNIGNVGTINSVAQSSWNIDKLDGTGPSGETVSNWENNIIYVIDFEWLGVGRVRFGVVVAGMLIYVHEFLHSNITKGVYMSSPNHSIRYEIRSSGSAGVLTHICSSVQSEGGANPRFKERVVNTGITSIPGPVKDTEWALCGFRLASGVINAGGINVNVQSVGVMTTTSNANGGWRLKNTPTIAGSLTWLPLPNTSGVEYFVGSSANTITGGLATHQGYYTSAGGRDVSTVSTLSRIGLAISGASQIMVLTNFNAVNNSSMFGNIDIEVID